MPATTLGLVLLALGLTFALQPRRWLPLEGRLVRRDARRLPDGRIEVIGRYVCGEHSATVVRRVVTDDVRVAIRQLPARVALELDTENPTATPVPVAVRAR